MEYVKVIDLVDVNGENALFGSDPTCYEVPVYQRPFAWGSDNRGKRPNEIIQLLEDVLMAEGDYYLGSLVVAKSHDPEYDFEVIDGQQRLTALYIIFACLGYKVKGGSLGYACRDDSKELLNALAVKGANKIVSNPGNDEKEDEKSGIRVGVRTVLRWLAEQGGVCERLKEKLKGVKLFRIEVPEGTDLNQYFEIMNTRGEQLEQQDIVKAGLMGELQDGQQRKVFAEVWDACSDMDGYCQMHFSGEKADCGRSRRETIFEGWVNPPKIEIVQNPAHSECAVEARYSFEDLVDIDPDYIEKKDDGESFKNAKFESIVDFAHFLLHALHVFNCVFKSDAVLFEQTDTAKLQDEFHKVFPRGCGSESVMKFISCLATCRYNFDRYVIKREFGSVHDEGVWSIKELQRSVTGKGKNKKESPYYRNTQDEVGINPELHRRLLMLEACLRVSYTNPKVMHWITELLKWLYDRKNPSLSDLHDVARTILRRETKKFLDAGDFNLGVKTPNVVLNYLDYLLWLNRGELSRRKGYERIREDASGGSTFAFEFRDSVEHWYPQHPDKRSEGLDEWGQIDSQHGTVDRFGNLALLPSNVNAHFSNQPPAGKCGYDEKINGGSLKLRIMASLTLSCSESCRNLSWRNEVCAQHEKEMLEILRNDVNLPV